MKSWKLRFNVVVGELVLLVVLILATTIGLAGVRWSVRHEVARLTALMQTRAVDILALADALSGTVAKAEVTSPVHLAQK